MHNLDLQASPPLTVAVTHRDDASLVIAVRGEVDLATAPRLEAALIEAIEAHTPERVIIDVAAMPFLDAAGMTAFVRAYRRATERHVDIRMDNAQPCVRAALSIVNLLGFLQVSAEPEARR